jgi:hypothetical protein
MANYCRAGIKSLRGTDTDSTDPDPAPDPRNTAPIGKIFPEFGFPSKGKNFLIFFFVFT